MKKKNLSTIILVLVFIAGIAILLYPTVADWWNNRVQTQVVNNYNETVENMNEEDYSEAFAEADAYNAALKELSSPLTDYENLDESEELLAYDEQLQVTDTGIMGYISIPKIDVELPIYHGTSESVLSVAVGHLEGTSLPVGGEGTHCVLSAHRGLPSARLFTDLDELEVGDTFTITVLNRLLTYQVDQIRTVLPEEVSELQIEDGKDYVTLLTCTPYGINTHRLLVRGVRIENAEEEITVTGDAYKLDSAIVAPAVAAVLLTLLMLYLLFKYRKRRD